MLCESADDLIKEVLTIINESRSVLGIDSSADQLFIVCDLFGYNLVNLNALLLTELLGGALRVLEYPHGEGVHPVVYTHLRFPGCLENLAPCSMWCIIIINVIFLDECKGVGGRVTLLLFSCESKCPRDTTTLTPFSLSQDVLRSLPLDPGK